MRLLNKLTKAAGDIFFRLYPWQINFFYETLKYNPLPGLLKFIMKNNLKKGPYIAEYENAFVSCLDKKGAAFSFATGRMALYAVLEAMGIGKNDEVIVPAFTCEVVVHALLYRGIKPVYADIEPYTFNIALDKLEEKITAHTKAIIAQHTFGAPCAIEKITALAEKHNLFVIEDCALSLGSSYKGMPLGTFGHAAIFSTDRTKVASTQFGGIAFSRNPGIAKALEKIYLDSPLPSAIKTANIALQVIFSYPLLSAYAYFWGKYIFKLCYKFSLFFDYTDDKNNFYLPDNYPCRFSNFQSFLGIAQIAHLQDNLDLREKTVNEYISILRRNNLRLPYGSYGQTRLRFSLLLKDRNNFIRKWRKYFEVGNWFDSPVYGWYSQMEKVGYARGSCPTAEKVHKHIINFPTHQTDRRMRNFIFNIVASIREEDVLYPENLTNERNDKNDTGIQAFHIG